MILDTWGLSKDKIEDMERQATDHKPKPDGGMLAQCDNPKCKRFYWAKRRDSKVCCQTCRKAVYRQSKKRAENAKRITVQIPDGTTAVQRRELSAYLQRLADDQTGVAEMSSDQRQRDNMIMCADFLRSVASGLVSADTISHN